MRSYSNWSSRAMSPSRSLNVCSRHGCDCRAHRSRAAASHVPSRKQNRRGTHAALFGVNPWRLQAWMGHKRIDETMLYVHVAEAHARELPEEIRAASIGDA